MKGSNLVYRYLPFEVKYNKVIGTKGSTYSLSAKEVQKLYLIGLVVPRGNPYSSIKPAYPGTIQDWVINCQTK